MQINRASYVTHTPFVMMLSSMTSECDFDNSQTLAQDNLLASWVMGDDIMYHIRIFNNGVIPSV